MTSSSGFEMRPDYSRRMSLTTLSTPNEYLRPRSNSIGVIGALETRDYSLRTPTPYPNRTKRFEFPSPCSSGKDSYDSPFDVLTGRPVFALERANVLKLTRTATPGFKVALGLFLCLLTIVIGGVLISKVVPKSKVSCFGHHFCYPSSVSVQRSFKILKILDSGENDAASQTIQNAIQMTKIKSEERENSKLKIFTPRAIPTFVGTIPVSKLPAKEDQISSSEDKINTENVDKQFHTPKSKTSLPSKEGLKEKGIPVKDRSPFMHEVSDRDRKYKFSQREHYLLQERERDYYRDHAPRSLPPGVNPRVYDRSHEL